MRKVRLAPIHPGVYLKELLDELGLSQYRLAHDIGVPAMRISHVVRGTRPLTAELALRLGRYFGQSSRYWIISTWPRMPSDDRWPGRCADVKQWRD